jgi:hypothetical protein
LGQTLELRLEHHEATDADGATVAIRHVRGEGVILDGADRPFHDAVVRSGSPDEVRAWAERTARPRARLRIGGLTLAAGVHHELDAGGFDRHTFLCGQSGSGKTYALGVILERLLAETELRLVILDPNSDFVRLGHVRAGADPGQAGDTAKQRAGSRSIPPAPRTGSGSGWHCASSRPPPRPPCCGSIRSRTATSTRSSRRCSRKSSLRRSRR